MELLLVPLPGPHPGFNRGHASGFALPEVPAVTAPRAGAVLALPLPWQSLQKLLPDPGVSAELRRQLAEPGALSGARQHEKNVGIS